MAKTAKTDGRNYSFRVGANDAPEVQEFVVGTDSLSKDIKNALHLMYLMQERYGIEDTTEVMFLVKHNIEPSGEAVKPKPKPQQRKRQANPKPTPPPVVVEEEPEDENTAGIDAGRLLGSLL